MLDIAKSLAGKCVSDCMTAPVVTIGPDDSARAAAEIMLRLRVSGLPVVDKQGRPLGVVSESDFSFGDAATRHKRRENWVKMLSGGQQMAADYLDILERDGESVRQIMASPAICVEESAGIDKAGALMSEHRIKRLPVLRDGAVAGMVTRADLLRFFAPQAHPPTMPITPELFEEVVEKVLSAKSKSIPEPASPPAGMAGAQTITAAALKSLVAQFERDKSRMRADVLRLGKEGARSRSSCC
jgi:CBS domain-containing protein